MKGGGSKGGAVVVGGRDNDFLSPAELSFYHVLVDYVGGRWVVLSKVRLADICFVKQPNENKSYFGRISQKYIDFLLCHPKMMRPVVGIELDVGRVSGYFDA